MKLFGPTYGPLGRADSLPAKRDVIFRLFKLWESKPSLRLGQLIANVLTVDAQFYAIEDSALIDTLENFYKGQTK